MLEPALAVGMRAFGRRLVAVLAAAPLVLLPLGARAEPPREPASTDDPARAAQAAFDAGDYDGAIGRWSALLDQVPRTAAYAAQRASLLLAIVGAHERAFAEQRDPMRLRAAIDLLDAYLGDLDPQDDENRVAVEGRRRALAAQLEAVDDTTVAGAGDDDVGPRRGVDEAVETRRRARRLDVAGGVTTALGGAGLVLLGVGLVLGDRANDDLARALASGYADPERSQRIRDALADGNRADDLALGAGVVGGALLVTGLGLLAAGRRLRPAPAPTALGLGLAASF